MSGHSLRGQSTGGIHESAPENSSRERGSKSIKPSRKKPRKANESQESHIAVSLSFTLITLLVGIDVVLLLLPSSILLLRSFVGAIVVVAVSRRMKQSDCTICNDSFGMTSCYHFWPK